ncbi:DUF4422 domain-containing protein [Bacillus sp. UMB0893]|uniref:DUF4422 domain-containing protein n=1 Tax=Bacillus sp. UMB0893 TaxID=2066053 RepID=UPI000C767CBB|nr:DUF4422 domain-containing protein [Bacillus sp. UMB0893]PLR67924.1 exopolysaccharide biosynthesis protein [Bacillus sp. UMB0893]
MKNIKILVATHKKYQMPKSDMYLPLHVGREGKADLGYQGDNTGDNISLKNPSYCELTGIYWAWKNLTVNNIGLCHYRRYFTIQKKTFNAFNRTEMIERALKESDINKVLETSDIILPKKRNYYIESVWSHYQNAHNIKDLEETKKIIEEISPEYLKSFENIMSGSTLYLFNMFVMKKEVFDNYCEWLFDILFELEKRIDISNYDNYQKRVFGFISERLFNVWLDYNEFSVKNLDLLPLEKTNQLAKYVNFLKRKFQK